MKKSFVIGMLFLSAVYLMPFTAFAKQIVSRATGFEMPTGSIVYMGSYYNPLKVHDTGSDNHFLVSKDDSLFAHPFFVAGKDQAVNETNQALQEIVDKMKLPVTIMPLNAPLQVALLSHIFNPAKNPYNPEIAKYCGNNPYVLVVLVDYYAEFASSITLREKEKDQKIDYMGKRSIIEKDDDPFQNRGRQAGVALELFLVSTQDGSTVWQCNAITTNNSNGSKYYDLCRGVIENAFKNLMKQ